MLKAVVIIVLCALTLYAPIELTRVIIVYCLEPKTTFELGYLWLTYLVAVGILIKVVKC